MANSQESTGLPQPNKPYKLKELEKPNEIDQPNQPDKLEKLNKLT